MCIVVDHVINLGLFIIFVHTYILVIYSGVLFMINYQPTHRSPRRLGNACCEACPIRLTSSGVGLSGGRKAGLSLKE